jgi:hypothetical protein
MTRSKSRPAGERIGLGNRADLDDLLHPARAFERPMDVVDDADLTVSEKRSILAAWASDACAVEARNELRTNGEAVVRWDDIMDALRMLDRQKSAQTHQSSWTRWQQRRWRREDRPDVGLLA